MPDTDLTQLTSQVSKLVQELEAQATHLKDATDQFLYLQDRIHACTQELGMFRKRLDRIDPQVKNCPKCHSKLMHPTRCHVCSWKTRGIL